VSFGLSWMADIWLKQWHHGIVKVKHLSYVAHFANE